MADTVLFLASPASSLVSGETIALGCLPTQEILLDEYFPDR